MKILKKWNLLQLTLGAFVALVLALSIVNMPAAEAKMTKTDQCGKRWQPTADGRMGKHGNVKIRHGTSIVRLYNDPAYERLCWELRHTDGKTMKDITVKKQFKRSYEGKWKTVAVRKFERAEVVTVRNWMDFVNGVRWKVYRDGKLQAVVHQPYTYW